MEEILTIIIADDNELIANIMKSNIEKEDKYRVIGIAKDQFHPVDVDRSKQNQIGIGEMQVMHEAVGGDKRSSDRDCHHEEAKAI